MKINTITKNNTVIMGYLYFTIFCFFSFNSFVYPWSNSFNSGVKGNLVSVEWLAKNLHNKELLILDASQPQQYSQQHIIGAINVNFMSYGVRELSLSDIEKRFQSWGIKKDKKIVIYDRETPMMATRIFFDLYYCGFPISNLFILDGGLNKWIESGKPVSNESPTTFNDGAFKITDFKEEVRVKLPEFLEASGDQENYVLLDALDAKWYFGEFQFFHRPGHIPFGVMLPSADFYNPDNTFKSPEEIQKMLDYFGITKQKKIYTYCGGGIAASVPFFALKFILDFPDVKLFRESEIGWVLDRRELPLWTYDKPFLTRETDWLKTWGGKMMRMYGVSNVDIIDVRSNELYKNGHIPFAINIPIDHFKKYLNKPEKLAEIFSQYGINPSNEAVIVSDGGLNDHSALAYLILDYLGHDKISIFIDSNERFIQSGIPLEKEDNVSDNKSSAVTTSKYIPNIKSEILLSDQSQSKGLYEKVFIESGKSISNLISDGKVLHIPYTDFIDNNGKPKSAKEIWQIIQTAGVPRYSDIIFVSNNPGEAAANYFIFKLMGFPDLNVLVK